MGANDSLTGSPGRLNVPASDNTLKTFAKETGGAYFLTPFEGELPLILQSIKTCCGVSTAIAFNPRRHTRRQAHTRSK